MSVKSGSKFIAGNLALKVQDRLFTAVRTLEGEQEYYDIIVPVGATLGFTEGTRLMVIIEGTNTTTTPILRYGATELYMVSSTMITNEAKIGELIDGNLMDMFIKSLSDVKPGTSTPMIYLGRTGNDYSFITNIPRFIGRNLNEKPLVAGLNYYTTLGLPYIEGNTLIVNDIDILSIDTNIISYGKPDFSQVHTFVSTNRINWRVSPTQIEELATLRDIRELAIADQFVDVLVYTRNTITLMNAINDMVIGDTCLTLENNTIYNWNGTIWVIQEVLNYNLTTDNGKYFDIEDIDGDNSGKAIWNIAEGGRFRVFTDYRSSIDGITIIRNSSSRALEVAKVPNSLTINNLDADGEVADTITFDGSSPQTFNVTVDLSNYYDKEDIDIWYNGATPGNISKFFTDTDGNVKLEDGNVVANDIVTKTFAGTYLQAQGSNVDASMIEFEDGSIEDFLGKDFAFVEVENDFVIGQSIAGELIATQDWAQNTFLPNNFDLNLLTSAAIQLNAPSAGRTSLRFARRNISSGTTSNLDVELPIVNGSNNGIVTPAQVATWNTVSNKVDKEFITDGLTSIINYVAGTPGIKSTYSDRSAEISILDDGATNGLRASLLSLNITDNLYSGILADKTGVYAFQKEGIAKNNAHRIATEGYVEQNVVLQDDIVTDLNNQWSGNKVVLGAFDFTILGESSATYRQFGSNVATGAEVTFDRAFPIVTSTLAGLATAGMFNQVETNKIAIESLQGQGQVGAELPQPPTQTDIQNAWDTAKPTIPSQEGSSVIDLITGNTWRLLDVEGVLTWVNLGVLGGTGQATNATTGVVKGSASGSGTIFVENDATMVVNGWDDLLSDVENLDLGLGTLDTSYTAHIADINFGNTAPHVTTQNRTDWNAAKTTADNAIPKVAEAVNNNLTMWSSGGVLKDSLLSIVTSFTTPTDLQIPTAKAVFDNYATKLSIPEWNVPVRAVGTGTGEPNSSLRVVAENPEAQTIVRRRDNGSVKFSDGQSNNEGATYGQAFNKVYKSLSDLTGIDASSTLDQLCDAMANNSYLNISTSGCSNLVPPGETDLNGQLEIIKVNENRVRLAWSYQNAARQPIYFATYRNAGGFLGWKRMITDSDEQTITGLKTFDFDTAKFSITSENNDYRYPLTSPQSTSTEKRFLLGVPASQSRYTNYNPNVYMENDKLYSNEKEVATTEAVANKVDLTASGIQEITDSMIISTSRAETPILKLTSGALSTNFVLERTKADESPATQCFLESGETVGLFGTKSEHPLRIRTNYIDRLTIDTSGNVGIGTTSPSEKLDVVGNIKSSGDVLLPTGKTLKINNVDVIAKLNNKLQTVSDEATAETQSLANPDNFYFYEEE